MNTEVLALLASIAETHMVMLYRRWEGGELDDRQFMALAVAGLMKLSARGVAMADLGLAAVLTIQTSQPVPTLGLSVPDGHQARLDAAVAGVMAAGLSEAAVTVLGRAEVLAAQQDAFQDGMAAHGVEWWTRVADADACPMCHDLTGPVLPVSTKMYAHKGCGCTTKPLTDGVEK